MLTHRGFTAWVTCDGKSLYEFKPVVNSDTNKVTCWIPSEPGKRFTVHWKDHGSLVDTASYIYLDGYMVPGYFLFGFGEASRGAMRVGPTMERPFVFAEADQGICSSILLYFCLLIDHGLQSSTLLNPLRMLALLSFEFAESREPLSLSPTSLVQHHRNHLV
ncbi:hypothetical protein K474DRAFT_1585057 [Panus rudis PR-1116 ss-1]|nr:hypothetical protein K474DRAFT_1585057 [Panus rudis PR-1116 ss-1]